MGHACRGSGKPGAQAGQAQRQEADPTTPSPGQGCGSHEPSPSADGGCTGQVLLCPGAPRIGGMDGGSLWTAPGGLKLRTPWKLLMQLRKQLEGQEWGLG